MLHVQVSVTATLSPGRVLGCGNPSALTPYLAVRCCDGQTGSSPRPHQSQSGLLVSGPQGAPQPPRAPFSRGLSPPTPPLAALGVTPESSVRPGQSGGEVREIGERAKGKRRQEVGEGVRYGR